MTARFRALAARLAATSLACLVGRHRSCREVVHGLFAAGVYCRCPSRHCTHFDLIAAKEAAP